jgi:hypothetical protein
MQQHHNGVQGVWPGRAALESWKKEDKKFPFHGALLTLTEG